MRGGLKDRDAGRARLTETSKAVARRAKLERRLAKEKAELVDAAELVRSTEDAAAKELADVERLEGATLTALLGTLLGTKEARLDKERKELVLARLRHEEAIARRDALRRSIEVTEDRIAALADARAEHDRALAEHRATTIEAGGAIANELLEVEAAIAKQAHLMRELEEAIEAGHEVAASLQRVAATLEELAMNDSFGLVGGGMTGYAHLQVDEARELARDASHAIDRFRGELGDAEAQGVVVGFDLDGIASFADTFLDALVSDWVVRSTVHDARRACSDTLAAVSGALADCETERERAVERHRSLERARLDVLAR